MRAVCRDAQRGKDKFADFPSVDIVQADARDADAIAVALAGVAGIVSCAGTTAFPSAMWRGGNTPHAVNVVGLGNVLRAVAGGSGGGSSSGVGSDSGSEGRGGSSSGSSASGGSSGGSNGGSDDIQLKRFVMLSSVGVSRRGSLPFSLLNTFGVLDALAEGESLVSAAAAEHGFDYVIVRPGQLIDDAEITSLQKPSGVQAAILDVLKPRSALAELVFQRGDELLGDVSRLQAAEVLGRALTATGAANAEFGVIARRGDAPADDGAWDALFASL